MMSEIPPNDVICDLDWYLVKSQTKCILFAWIMFNLSLKLLLPHVIIHASIDITKGEGFDKIDHKESLK